MDTPRRQIRAAFDENAITVYQAYDPAIAAPAVAAQSFVAPFKRERMTWIKPSFLWMMYRCGWATEPGQGRVLAIEITREGFEWALAHSCRSHPAEGEDQGAWKSRLAASSVRVQWDPERDIRLERLEHRSIQIGLSGEAVDRYVDQWIVSIADVTDLAREVSSAVEAADIGNAGSLLPSERPYPIPADLGDLIGASVSENPSAGT